MQRHSFSASVTKETVFLSLGVSAVCVSGGVLRRGRSEEIMQALKALVRNVNNCCGCQEAIWEWSNTPAVRCTVLAKSVTN